MVQLLPFHTSARAGKLLPVRDSPTASHAVAAVHETSLSRLMVAPPTSWVLLIVQLLPFHSSASVSMLPPLMVAWPTASHRDAETHETSLSWLEVTPAGFGVDWTPQELPFHTSASVSVVPPLSNCPTASQDDDDVHQMPGSCAPPGSGMLTIVQVLPLRLSESRLLPTFPTAMQVAVPVQDTALSDQVGFDPDGVGVLCCCQLAEAGCAITRTPDTTSAAVTANRFIASSLPQEFRWSVPWARCHARYAWLGSPARTPQHGAMDPCARPERGHSGDRKHRMRKVPLPSPCSNTYLSSRSDRK